MDLSSRPFQSKKKGAESFFDDARKYKNTPVIWVQHDFHQRYLMALFYPSLFFPPHGKRTKTTVNWRSKSWTVPSGALEAKTCKVGLWLIRNASAWLQMLPAYPWLWNMPFSASQLVFIHHFHTQKGQTQLCFCPLIFVSLWRNLVLYAFTLSPSFFIHFSYDLWTWQSNCVCVRLGICCALGV